MSKSRLDRWLHAIEPILWRMLLAELFKDKRHDPNRGTRSTPYGVGCDNIRIRRWRLYPLGEMTLR